MFGYLGGAPHPFAVDQAKPPPVIIAFQILPLIEYAPAACRSAI